MNTTRTYCAWCDKDMTDQDLSYRLRTTFKLPIRNPERIAWNDNMCCFECLDDMVHKIMVDLHQNVGFISFEVTVNRKEKSEEK